MRTRFAAKRGPETRSSKAFIMELVLQKSNTATVDIQTSCKDHAEAGLMQGLHQCSAETASYKDGIKGHCSANCKAVLETWTESCVYSKMPSDHMKAMITGMPRYLLLVVQ